MRAGSLSNRKQLIAAVVAAGLLAAIFVPFQSAQAATVDFTTNGDTLSNKTFTVSSTGAPITIEIELGPAQFLDFELPVSITPGFPGSGGFSGIIDLDNEAFTANPGTSPLLFQDITIQRSSGLYGYAYGYSATNGYVGPMTITINAILGTSFLHPGTVTTPSTQTLQVVVDSTPFDVSFKVVGQQASSGTGGGGGGGGGGGRSVILTWPPIGTQPDSYFEDRPLERFIVTSSGFFNSTGASISQVQVGQQISISGTFSNQQQKAQTYAFIIQVTDENDVVTDLMWQIGTLGAGSTTDVSNSWTPKAPGTYKVTIFVWDGISFTANPLSEVIVMTIEAS